jgi:hypothetical protein
MGYARAGLGMYPDETCFDPTRPSWMPYWFDTFGEEACKANEFLWGNTTGNNAQPGQPGAAAATIQNAAAACASQGGSWDPSTNTCTPSPLGQFSAYLPWIFAGLGLVIVLPLVMGRR